jgi:3-oxoacyl-[acyl-carrier protein] reductase
MTQKIFWITGAASGLGQALTTAALKAGHSVFASDVTLEALEVTAAAQQWPRDRALLSALDVRNPTDWDNAEKLFLQRWSRLDVMINNAGILLSGPLSQVRDNDVHRMLDINVKGVMFGSQRAAALMLKQGHSEKNRGHIVNMGSMSSLAPVPGIGLYSASKFAVRGYSLALAMELKDSGIAVTCVCPDGINTPMLKAEAKSKDAALIFSGGRILTTEEVRDAILGPILEKRPMEYILPDSRGWMAKASSVAPETTSRILTLLQKRGLKNQQKNPLS